MVRLVELFVAVALSSRLSRSVAWVVTLADRLWSTFAVSLALFRMDCVVAVGGDPTPSEPAMAITGGSAIVVAGVVVASPYRLFKIATIAIKQKVSPTATGMILFGFMVFPPVLSPFAVAGYFTRLML